MLKRAVLVFAMMGCGSEGEPIDAGIAADATPACSTLQWSPTLDAIALWPDPALMSEEESATGIRIRVDPDRFPTTTRDLRGYAPILLEDLEGLDGFGNNASLFARFDRRVNGHLPTMTDGPDSVAGVGIVLLGHTPSFHPAELSTIDEGETLVLTPLTPLPERQWAVFYITTSLGECLAPSPAMRESIELPDEHLAQALGALQDLGVIADVSELAVAVAFPVQTITHTSQSIAEEIRGREFTHPSFACTQDDGMTRCEGEVTTRNYRNADGIVDDETLASSAYDLPVSVWLPESGEPPYPTILYGPALGASRHQGARFAALASPYGFATVAIDPVEHGEHPSVSPEASTTPIATLVRFFTVGDLRERALEPRRMRDNWRQSSYDKLQIIELLRAGIDLDDDGTPDLDSSGIAYLGVSLGGIMAPEFLAMTDIDAAVIVTPGGRVTSIIGESEAFGPLLGALRPPALDDGDVTRFLTILQTILDPGDAASYAPHVVSNRLFGSPPHLLAGVVIDDNTVPNVASYYLFRAAGLPLVAQELEAAVGIEGPLATPVRHNIDGRTVGFLQFDVVRTSEGVEAATHVNVGDSEQGIEAWFHFLSTHAVSGVPEIVDPYSITELPHR